MDADELLYARNLRQGPAETEIHHAEAGIGVTGQLLAPLHGCVEIIGREGSVAKVAEGRLVGGDHAEPRPANLVRMAAAQLQASLVKLTQPGGPDPTASAN